MKKHISASLIAICFAVTSSFAQQFDKTKLNGLLDTLAVHNKAMGSIAISKNGKVAYSKAIGYGVYNGKEKKPATTKTKYRIGSISKMFTATIIFQLIEDGKISLTTTVDKYFPQLPNANTMTIGNLLNHHSGLHNFTNDSLYQSWSGKPKTETEMLRVIANGIPDTTPGMQGSYSNSNYVILGYIAEKICGKPYSRLLQERIASKVGLTNTYYGGKTDTRKDESYSYKYLGKWNQEPETDMSIPGGAGAIVSTPADLDRFITALFSLKLIHKTSLDQMTTMTDGFGYGIFQFPFGERKAYGHTGGIDGFGSMLAYLPDDSSAIAYCGNGQVYPINDIMIGALSIYYNIPYTIPDFKIVAIQPQDLDQYLGVYSSTQMPLKVTITKDNNTLIAQATGQSAFPLEAQEKDKFKFDAAGVIIEFTPAKNEMQLKQGGRSFLFTKEK